MNHQEVAIVGYACRVPGAGDSRALWRLLLKNRCSVSQITPDRFPTQAFFHPLSDQRGRSYTFAAGVIDDVWGFDAGAFGMSPREAEQVDPQQRHLLEVTHDALAQAGIRPSTLAGRDVGVYIGASSADHAVRFFVDTSAADVHMMTGNSLSIIANRLSYALDLRGPSLTVDTACSSSMVALDLAAEAIRSGAIDTAIVGGVNLVLSPFSYIGFSRASMLSPTGLCRPFDAAADGYVRAEGAIVVVLRSMAAAHKARDRIHAVIVGSGVNQDGRTTGLALPSAESQRSLLEQVYAKFSVDPADLSFVEAHGTGTQVGDPIEADALGKGLGQRRSRPLAIGSVKSNIGHLEPVSGLAGLLKSILALDHGILPATLHQQSPSPNIPFDELNLDVVGHNRPLAERRGPDLVGVNSFGFGGTNAHTILRSERSIAGFVQTPAGTNPPPMLLTAHSADALPVLAAAYVEAWPTDPRRVPGFISASAHLRDALPHRLIVRGTNPEDTRQQLDRFARGEAPPVVLTDQALGNDLPVTFLFSGNGSQWAGMGRDACRTNLVFKKALDEVDKHFAKVQKWSILEVLFAENLAGRLRRATYAQPLLFALQVATVRALEECGVTPTATLGHSVGEIAAAWCAGVLTLEQAIDVVCARSRHQELVRGSGTMAALMLSDREAKRFLISVGAPAVEIAAINSWRSVTVSGSVAEIDTVVEAATKLRISARRLDLDYPFHSALVDPIRGPLQREIHGLKPLPPRRKFVSSVAGTDSVDYEFGAEHWWRNVREPVQFEEALTSLLQDEARIFVEIGPRPVLASYVRDVMRESSLRGVIFETLSETETQGASDPIERCVSRVVLVGGQVDRQRFFGPPPPVAIQLPLYPWRHTQFKIAPTNDAGTVLTPARHPLLGQQSRVDGSEWYSTIDPALYPWIADHKVEATTILPATAYVEIFLAAARDLHEEGPLELRDFDIVRPLVFDGTSSLETKVRLASETGVAEFLSRTRGSVADWILNARGIVGRSPIAGLARVLPKARRGNVLVWKPSVYACALDLGFDYGPTFQRVEHVIFPEPKFAIATLNRISALVAGSQIIDLIAMDAGFHALFASEEAGVADMPMKRMLPVRFGCVRVFVPGAVVTHVTARTLRQSPTSIVLDMELWNDEGQIVVAAHNIRLVEAPVDLVTDKRSLSYRLTPWRLDEAGAPAIATLTSSPQIPFLNGKIDDIASLKEGLLLVEAGSLRAAWTSLSKDPVSEGAPARDDDDATTVSEHWPAFVRSALLWHLESRNLVVESGGVREIAATCELPEISSIAASLLIRHPTMASEAACLSRFEDIIGGLISGDPGTPAELSAPHWKQLNIAASQIVKLRNTVMADVEGRLAQCKSNRLLRVLMLGADHVSAAIDLCERFANLEITISDLDDDRLEQSRATLGEDAPQVRSVSWSQLESLSESSLDFAFAIDALSEIAAMRSGLDRIIRLLRPGAVIVAAELAPGVFWDVVRGPRRSWWARSASVDFPVGALLTVEEWRDELQGVGFSTVAADAIDGEANIGVLLCAVAEKKAADVDDSLSDLPVFRWQGSGAPDLQVVVGHNASDSADVVPSNVTDIVLAIAVAEEVEDSVARLSEVLESIAEQCRLLEDTTVRCWIIADFGPALTEPLEHPLWCALASSLRVAQNEYSGLEIRLLGLSGSSRSLVLKRAAAEMMHPGDERELFFAEDQRIAFRVERGSTPLDAPAILQEGAALRVAPRQGATRGALAWVTDVRPSPRADEVEIAVATTGLNFRDVMWNLRLLPEEALEDGYSGPGLGMECAGRITRVGDNVQGLRPGDRVLAFVPNAFASHVIAPLFAVSELPDHISFEAATTLPVAFLTAYYALAHLGNIRQGETVLIHGGAGAVGLAALQVAKLRGAFVIATAGSEEKRALLRNIGADLVCNSRSLAFVEEVMTHTGGKGVDVVLNSLAGEAMVRSLDCLKSFGRFIELGKRDFYANTHLGLRPLRRNLSYFGVDVDQLLSGHKELAQRLFSEVITMFAEGKLVPLPYRVFDGTHIAEAFRLMQRANHIGKIVVTPPERASVDARATGVFPVNPSGIHVVIGGTSGFGLATAEWLAERGARQLLLASKSGQLSATAERQVSELRAKGIEVEIAIADATDFASLHQLLERKNGTARIAGIVNAAMVLDDRLMQGLDRQAIEDVLRPKALAALHLERLAQNLDLDYLLLFSSATTLFGNPGQFNYVAANGFVEGVARRMRASGQPALAIAWGAIEDAGYLARHMDANAHLKKRFASTLMTARMALNGLDWAFASDGRQKTACCAIARIDWSVAKRELAAVRTPTFVAIDTAAAARQGGHAAVTLEKLRSMPAEEVASALLDIVVDEIARVLRLPPKEVDRHRPLADIGMDSLMMLELRTTVEVVLQVDLPMMSLASGITPADVARRIAPLIVGEKTQDLSVPSALIALSSSHFAAEAEATTSADAQAAVGAVQERVKQLDIPR